jgi:Ni,Fe-hydrogenase III small subunit
MQKKQESLTIFSLAQPLFETEFFSLKGDKFRDALPFGLEFVDNFQSAQVIAWNGLVTPKSSEISESILKRLQEGAVLLYIGEPRTLYKNHPFVKFISTENMKVVTLSGYDALPEELLLALQQCREKMQHV